jgi:hypothetical protein
MSSERGGSWVWPLQQRQPLRILNQVVATYIGSTSPRTVSLPSLTTLNTICASAGSLLAPSVISPAMRPLAPQAAAHKRGMTLLPGRAIPTLARQAPGVDLTPGLACKRARYYYNSTRATRRCLASRDGPRPQPVRRRCPRGVPVRAAPGGAKGPSEQVFLSDLIAFEVRQVGVGAQASVPAGALRHIGSAAKRAQGGGGSLRQRGAACGKSTACSLRHPAPSIHSLKPPPAIRGLSRRVAPPARPRTRQPRSRRSLTAR